MLSGYRARKRVVPMHVAADVKGRYKAVRVRKMVFWCSERTVSIAAIELSETSLAGGINESGLKQDRCEGQRGRNPRGSHLYASRWLVEDVVGDSAATIFSWRFCLVPCHLTAQPGPPPSSGSRGSLPLGNSCVFLVCSPVCSTWQLCFPGQSSLSSSSFVFPFLLCSQVSKPGCCNLQRT